VLSTLSKRRWDITHAFHISGQEMTITPHDFHHSTSLRFDGVPINLKDKSGIQLGIDLLGRRYATETIHYTDLEADFMCRPQGTAEECL